MGFFGVTAFAKTKKLSAEKFANALDVCQTVALACVTSCNRYTV